MSKNKDKDEKGQSLGGYIAEETFIHIVMTGIGRGITWVIGGIVSVFTSGN